MKYELNVVIDLDEEEENTLKKVFDKETDNGSIINNDLERLTKASVYEYIDMICNEGIPSRIHDLKTKRLLFLIENYFEDTIPKESELISLFRINERSAKAVIDDTISLYQNRIESKIIFSIKEVLENFILDEDDSTFDGVIESKVLFDKINEIITREKPGLEKISKKRKTSGKYTCKEDTYNFLKDKYLEVAGEESNE